MLLLVLKVKSHVWKFSIKGSLSVKLDAQPSDQYIITCETIKLAKEIKQICRKDAEIANSDIFLRLIMISNSLH